MSNNDDPFALPEAGRTVIMPTPGGRTTTGQNFNRAVPRDGASPAQVVDAPVVAGINPLVAAANPLLDVIPQLRTTLNHPDASALRDYLVEAIKRFETRAREAGTSAENIIAARYVLCTVLDETAASTPWGGSGMWARNSLLVLFHNETWGGEKFFQLLSKLAENPAGNRSLLELMYVCLAFGFEGRYRVIDNGRAQLEALRERLAQILKKTAGDYERDLSPRWKGVVTARSKILDALPFWIAAALAMAIMLGVYFVYRYKLGDLSDHAYAKIQSIRVAAPAPAPAPVAAAPVPARLATFLAPEIAQGLVAVRDERNMSMITIRGDGLFEPGSTNISARYVPLMQRIADALKAVPGKVQVIGHTDNQPIRTARFPSNWHLSEERARMVSRLLAQAVPSERLVAEGRADAEPIADNTSAEGRSRNRRIEVTLFVEGKGT
jgi:type VI secretion system protein ImpK